MTSRVASARALGIMARTHEALAAQGLQLVWLSGTVVAHGADAAQRPREADLARSRIGRRGGVRAQTWPILQSTGAATAAWAIAAHLIDHHQPCRPDRGGR